VSNVLGLMVTQVKNSCILRTKKAIVTKLMKNKEEELSQLTFVLLVKTLSVLSPVVDQKETSSLDIKIFVKKLMKKQKVNFIKKSFLHLSARMSQWLIQIGV